MCSSPTEHLIATIASYIETYDCTLFKVLEEELKGSTEEAANFFPGMKLRPDKTVAKLIKKSCDGMGTDELLLSSCLIRYQSILPQIEDAFAKLYGEPLKEFVTKEQGRDLRRLYAQIFE